MSTITDAVEKKKQEEELKNRRGKIDLANPPVVNIPRDRTWLKRFLLLFLIIILAGGAGTAGYYYRSELKEFVSSFIGKKPGDADNAVINPQKKTDTTVDSGTKEPEEESNTTGQEDTTVADTGKNEPEPFPEVIVEGIFFDPLEPEVLINGHWRRTGEEVDGVIILQILKDRVRLKHKETERTVYSR